MIFRRKIETRLAHWKAAPNRKPLILRGARQVGKSTLVQQLGAVYPHFVPLNLERAADQRFFSKDRDVKEIWQQIRFERNIPDHPAQTLLFIDEIQEIPSVIRMLRYFYEDLPELHVIAAGSLLEFALGDVGSFPVGRTEEMNLHPFDFEEFLMALGEDAALSALRNIPIPSFAYDKLFRLFKQYLIIGGMPEIVKQYVEQGFELNNLKTVYASIWNAYQSDVVKYAKNDTEAKVMRHVIASAPYLRDRISFNGFGASNYRSREVGEALRALDLAKIIYLVYPTTQTAPPQVPDLTKKPRLQFLDVGLLNYAADIQAELLSLEDLNAYYKGFIVHQAIAQELMANATQAAYRPAFWVKENTGSNAEVDLTYKWNNLLIPIEVKSGAKGSLRSLHECMDLNNSPLAVRFLHHELSLESVTTRNGKTFQLLNIPYFATTQLDQCIEWAFRQMGR
jgi:uncharacterized protein